MAYTPEAVDPRDVAALTAAVQAGDLAALTQSEPHVSALGELFVEPSTAEPLFSFCAAAVARRDVRLAGLLAIAVQAGFGERVAEVARERVIRGPLVDALSTAPLLGDGHALADPALAEARARLEILIWEAGASAREIPALGPWIFGDASVFDALVAGPAHGALRGRVLAARCLEISVGGLPADADQDLLGRLLQVLQPLLLHPEPLVWVHAARALGRLTGPLEQMEGTLLDWVLGDTKVLRQRAITAFASLPADRFAMVAGQLAQIISSRDEDAWVLAAVAAATPYLFFERRDLWSRLEKRILAGDAGAIGARALARGLATLHRRGVADPAIERPLRALRELARAARPTRLDEARRWLEVQAVTDVLDGAERDPLDLELGLENLVRVAAQYDDEEADARAARFAGSLGRTFEDAWRIALAEGRVRHRAAAINALEACARAFALRLWSPLLATSPSGEHVDEPDLEETWRLLFRAPAELLDAVKARTPREDDLEVLAIRLGGYALDACDQDDAGKTGARGPAAHDTCKWLRLVEGLADGSRELPPPLKSALSALFWRLVDTTRGTALGEVDDVAWLGPFAAWWALVIDRPQVLQSLATALPMMAEGALDRCCGQADELRSAVSAGLADGEWWAGAEEALEALKAQDTELGVSLSGFAAALGKFKVAVGQRKDLEALCLDLVLASDRLHHAVADPVKALHPATVVVDDSLTRNETENAPRIAAMVARSIRSRDLSLLDVWIASLGPVTSTLVEDAVKAAIRKTPPPPPAPKKQEPKVFSGYELVKPLGEGGVGTVWLVRKPGADRLFVLKMPKADALAEANDVERAGILASFVEEAKALAGLYHPNVANIIDRGVVDDAPFLVLEYLIGADLKQYAWARAMSLFELRQVVLDACAGLAALHSAGLVHRDIKPANLWLRLPLAGGEIFDAEKHRDPARVMPLSTVVIDFGMVRAIRVAKEAGGRFVAGTPGYLAPEQVLDPVELDPRADVYALAATIYNVTTHRAFFDDEKNARDRIIAHMRRDPFEDESRLRGFPAGVIKLLRAATALDPRDRPFPLEFGRALVEAL